MDWDLKIDAWNFPIAIKFKSTSTAASKSSPTMDVVEEESTYSGIDGSFYDSPSGETISEYSQVTTGTSKPVEFKKSEDYISPSDRYLWFIRDEPLPMTYYDDYLGPLLKIIFPKYIVWDWD